MMTELIGDMVYKRGDSYPLERRVKSKSTGAYVDITGYTFLMTVNSEKDPVDTTNQLFQVVGVVDPDQVTNTGKVTFTPTTSDTDKPTDTYYYDIQITYGPGGIYNQSTDKYKFILVQDITK